MLRANGSLLVASSSSSVRSLGEKSPSSVCTPPMGSLSLLEVEFEVDVSARISSGVTRLMRGLSAIAEVWMPSCGGFSRATEEGLAVCEGLSRATAGDVVTAEVPGLINPRSRISRMAL